MSTENYTRYFDILELRPDASLSELRNAYLQLRALYSSDSIVTSPVADEFSDKAKGEILDQIEEAYAKLLDLFRIGYRGLGHNGSPPSVLGDDLKAYIENITSFSGQVLREIREKRNAELCEIAAATKVGKSHLENIEQERFDALPPEVYLRGFLSAYARCLSLDSTQVVDDYMEIYQTWKNGR